MMLAPVAHMVAVAVCILSSFVLLYPIIEVVIKSTMVRVARRRRVIIRNNIFWELLFSAKNIVYVFLSNMWPIVIIFGLTTLSHNWRKVTPAAQAPAPLA